MSLCVLYCVQRSRPRWTELNTVKLGTAFHLCMYLIVCWSASVTIDLGPVHNNPFSNENEAVLLRFQKDLRPHLLFSYRFALPYYNVVSVLKTLLYPQCACLNELDACAFQYISPRNWRWSHMAASVRHFGYSRSSGLAPGRVYFDDVIVFR